MGTDEIKTVIGYTITLEPKETGIPETRLTTHSEVYHFAKQLYNPKTIKVLGECNIIVMNNALDVTGLIKHSKSGILGDHVIDIRLILTTLLQNTIDKNIIIVMNRSTIKNGLSNSDRECIRKIIKVFNLFTTNKGSSLNLIDYLIITNKEYFSARENHPILWENF